uniref:Uncharacterized protein n=1 Tax=Anguilla anguilla TaxID=7936 RepID=A0A0E9VTW0_ANGAN
MHPVPAFPLVRNY